MPDTPPTSFKTPWLLVSLWWAAFTATYGFANVGYVATPGEEGRWYLAFAATVAVGLLVLLPVTVVAVSSRLRASGRRGAPLAAIAATCPTVALGVPVLVFATASPLPAAPLWAIVPTAAFTVLLHAAAATTSRGAAARAVTPVAVVATVGVLAWPAPWTLELAEDRAAAADNRAYATQLVADVHAWDKPIWTLNSSLDGYPMLLETETDDPFHGYPASMGVAGVLVVTVPDGAVDVCALPEDSAEATSTHDCRVRSDGIVVLERPALSQYHALVPRPGNADVVLIWLSDVEADGSDEYIDHLVSRLERFPRGLWTVDDLATHFNNG